MPNKESAQRLIEAVHLMRKHVLTSKRHGKAFTVKCLECGMNGANTPDEITHEPDCRYANLLSAIGSAVSYKAKSAVQAPDLDACTS